MAADTASVRFKCASRLDALCQRWLWLKHLFGDGAYDHTRPMDKAAFLDFAVEVVRRLAGQAGFAVLPSR